MKVGGVGAGDCYLNALPEAGQGTLATLSAGSLTGEPVCQLRDARRQAQELLHRVGNTLTGLWARAIRFPGIHAGSQRHCRSLAGIVAVAASVTLGRQGCGCRPGLELAQKGSSLTETCRVLRAALLGAGVEDEGVGVHDLGHGLKDRL